MIFEYFSKDYNGEPFELFGLPHLTALGIILAFNMFLVLYRKKFSEAQKVNIRYSIAGVLIVDEIIWHLWNALNGTWTLQNMLPLHLCSVFVFLSAVMLVKKSYGIFEFAYFLGIAGATQALITPDAGVYGFPHLRFFQVMISHGSIVSAAVYMAAVEGYRPYWRSLRQVIVVGNLYMAFVGLVNWALGSNYLFIARKPDTASLMDLLAPWPWYILQIELIGLVLFTLLYLPYFLRDRRVTREVYSV